MTFPLSLETLFLLVLNAGLVGLIFPMAGLDGGSSSVFPLYHDLDLCLAILLLQGVLTIYEVSCILVNYLDPLGHLHHLRGADHPPDELLVQGGPHGGLRHGAPTVDDHVGHHALLTVMEQDLVIQISRSSVGKTLPNISSGSIVF